MRTKLARFCTIIVLALVLGSATVPQVAAQTPVSSWQTTTVDRKARTVTVVTMTYYSDGTWSRTVETWSYLD